jgi:hypothetical protein
MSYTEDDSETIRKACCAAYSDAIRGAYKTLSDSISQYFDENRNLYGIGDFDIPLNFRPLKDYERTLKIQRATLRLALKAAEMAEYDVPKNSAISIHTNGQSV